MSEYDHDEFNDDDPANWEEVKQTDRSGPRRGILVAIIGLVFLIGSCAAAGVPEALQVQHCVDLGDQLNEQAKVIEGAAAHALQEPARLETAVDAATEIIKELDAEVSELEASGFRARPELLDPVETKITRVMGKLNCPAVQRLHSFSWFVTKYGPMLSALNKAYKELGTLKATIHDLRDGSLDAPTTNFIVNLAIDGPDASKKTALPVRKVVSPCGNPDARPAHISAQAWAGYECRVGSIQEGCLTASMYGDGTGCPGENEIRCCPPAT